MMIATIFMSFPQAPRSLLRETLGCLRNCLGPDGFAISRRRNSYERMNQGPSCLSHLLHGQIKRHFVGLGWLGEATELAHELKRRRLNLFVSRRRLEVEQSLDVSTHRYLQQGLLRDA